MSHNSSRAAPPNPSPAIPQISVHIPKNKSAANLFLNPSSLAAAPRSDRPHRLSLDTATPAEISSLKRVARNDQDGSSASSGLRRIRRTPLSRAPTFDQSNLNQSQDNFVPPTLQHAQTLPVSGTSSRSASRSNSTAQFFVGGPTSPLMDDLYRFPAESLHSFSFARQSEDFLHSRQAIIKKTVEFVRDNNDIKTNPGLAQAQARISGDTDLQGMMDLLKKAKVVPSLDVNTTNRHGLGLGPLTGPALLSNAANPFEGQFETVIEDLSDEERGLQILRSSGPISAGESSTGDPLPVNKTRKPQVLSQPSTPPRRVGLKRTYTDTRSISLQQSLLDALAQPYTSDTAIFTEGNESFSFMPGAPTPTTQAASVHSHSNKFTPPAQAFFRTNDDSPWTIVAANDLACLTFGITRAEVRSLSILGLIEQHRRQWLEDKLRPPLPVLTPPKSPVLNEDLSSKPSLLAGKSSITARLLSKAPSRFGKAAQKADTGGDNNRPKAEQQPTHHIPRKSRGVLLCGDVLPIQKRNGIISAASFWVMEKKGGLIWIVEEIIEDVAYLEYDSARRLVSSKGDISNIWGDDVRDGTKLRYLVPKLSFEDMDNPIFDGRPLLGHYTVSTSGGVNVPTTIAKVQGKLELRVSSLPHVAGMVVLNPDTMKISSSNAVFTQTLFGYESANGMHINNLVSNFGEILAHLEEQSDLELVEGLVIPEHSFRRARALLALQSGSEEATDIFLRPAGLPARHRDGMDIMVDVQLRVVRSGSSIPGHHTDLIPEDEEHVEGRPKAVSDTVYALWITYSRQLHSAGMGVMRPEHPLASRPATPPMQPVPTEPLPSPPQSLDVQTAFDTTSRSRDLSPTEPLEHPPPNMAVVPHKRKTISDFVILEDMGSGAYGEVKLARYNTSRNTKVVIKYVTKKKILVDTWIRDRRLGTTPLEIHVLDFLRRDGYKHPNIVEMVDFFEDDINYYIEMLPHGLPGMDLFDYIELRMGMQEDECKHIFRQVVDAIDHLHNKAAIVHRDIKDENVVLDGQNKVKLIDFGSAAYIRNGPFDVFVGTIDYAAPEVLQGRPYAGPEQDVWALGILLYTIVFRENPFYNIDEILDHPLRLPEQEMAYSENCISLIQAMLNRDVEERLDIKGVKNHEWLQIMGEG